MKISRRKDTHFFPYKPQRPPRFFRCFYKILQRVRNVFARFATFGKRVGLFFAYFTRVGKLVRVSRHAKIICETAQKTPDKV